MSRAHNTQRAQHSHMQIHNSFLLQIARVREKTEYYGSIVRVEYILVRDTDGND